MWTVLFSEVTPFGDDVLKILSTIVCIRLCSTKNYDKVPATLNL